MNAETGGDKRASLGPIAGRTKTRGEAGAPGEACRSESGRGLGRAVDTLTETLLAHLEQEEETLFPLLMGKENDDRTVQRQLQEMHAEHLIVAKFLDGIRREYEEFSLPEWASHKAATWLSLFPSSFPSSL